MAKFSIVTVLFLLLGVPVMQAALHGPRSIAEMIEIYDQFHVSGKDLLKVVLFNQRLFDDCIKSGSIRTSVILFFEAFIKQSGIIHRLPENENGSLAKRYFDQRIKSRAGSTYELTFTFKNCTKEEKQQFKAFFKHRRDWFTRFYTVKELLCVAEILGEEPGVYGKIPIPRAIELGVELLVDFSDLSDSASLLIASLATDDWKMSKNCEEALLALKEQSEDRFSHFGGFIKAVLNAPKTDALSLLVDFISEQRLERYDECMKKIEPRVMESLFREAIRKQSRALLGEVFCKILSPRAYHLIRTLNKSLLDSIITAQLRKKNYEPAILVLYDMSRFLEGKESQNVASRIEEVLKIKPCIKDTPISYGFPINELPDEVLSTIIYQSINSLAFSELVLKRVCKRWISFLDAEKAILNSLSVARQFFRTFDRQFYRTFDRDCKWLEPFKVDDKRETLKVEIMARWPLHVLAGSNMKYSWKLFDFLDSTGVDSVIFARAIRNIADAKINFTYFEFKFPKQFAPSDISVFVGELIKNGAYPENFVTTPKVSSRILDTFVVDGEFPNCSIFWIKQIVKQTAKNPVDILELLLEHRLLGQHNKCVIDLLVSQDRDIDQTILNLLPTKQPYQHQSLFLLCARFIVRYILETDRYYNISGLNDQIYNLILSTAFVEAKTREEFDVILTACLRANHGSTAMLDSYFAKSISEILDCR